MVRAMEQEQESYKSRLFHFKGMNNANNDNSSSRHVKSWSSDCVVKMDGESIEDDMMFRSHPVHERPILPPGLVSNRSDKGPNRTRMAKDEPSIASSEAKEAEIQAGKTASLFMILLELNHLLFGYAFDPLFKKPRRINFSSDLPDIRSS